MNKKDNDRGEITNIRLTKRGYDLITGFLKVKNDQLMEFENDTFQFYREGEEVVCIDKFNPQKPIRFPLKTS